MVAEVNATIAAAFKRLGWHHPVGAVQWVHIDQIQANDYNPNAVPHHEMNLLYTSVREDGYCVEESTPVLMADLTWKNAGLLQAGERIVAFDENRSGTGQGNELARKFRTAVVIANSVDESPLMEVATEKGSVFTTSDHPWLANANRGNASNRAMKWINSADLKPGYEVRYFVAPWEVESDWEAGWLAGFLDGEGCLSLSNGKHQKSMKLSGSQRPGATADRMVEMMSKYGDPRVFTLDRSRFPKQQDNVQCVFNRVGSIMRVLGSVRPQRLIDKAGEFWDGISTVRALDRVKVLDVRQAGSGRIARLSTSTGTFIGAGFMMHNTMPIVVIEDDERPGHFVIVDGYHRYTVMRRYPDIHETTGGYLPVAIIDKPMADRIASTVRHNRARGKHSVAGMGNLVFQMLQEGEDDAAICSKLGLEAEELARLKHITGYSKLYANAEYSKVSLAATQIEHKAAYKKEHPEEEIPQW